MEIVFDAKNVVLETERLILRGFELTDLDDFYAYASVAGVGEMAGWPHHNSIEITKAVLQSFLETNNNFAIFHKGDMKVIGSLGIKDAAWLGVIEEYSKLNVKNLGYVLSKDYWGRGLMPEAVLAVINYGFCTLGLDAFGVEHFVTNPQSKRVIEKCGFKFVENGVYYSKLLEKHFDECRYILLKEMANC